MHSLPMRAARRARRRTLVAFAMLPLLTALLLTGQGRPVQAAAPPGGTIGPATPSVTWQGQTYTAGHTVADPAACPPATDPANTLCDHFLLNVNVPTTYWNTNTGGAEISISWGSSQDDFDLYVYDASGTQVASSASGGTTSERVFVQSASGQYEVRVVPFLIASVPGSGYSGTAGFVSRAGGPAPNPTRASGGLVFAPATVIDAQRTEGEPINHIDRNGNYWESGPWGTSTQNSFIHRSTDGGNQFNIVSPVGVRPNTPPGGGDTDITTDDQLNAYFVDLEGLVNLGAAVSNDSGNSWRTNPFSVAHALDDRQWFAADNGTTSAAVDNTIFLAFRQVALGSYIYSTPGSTGPTDPIGGLVYSNSSSNPVGPISTGAPCGQLRFDPVKRNLYYPCAAGDHVELTIGHVNPGQRTGITFRTVAGPTSPGGAVGDIFPSVSADRAGNIYLVWIDKTNHNVYYAYSTNQGTTWSAVVQVNGNDANSNVFPWAVAGNAGTLAVAWYGTSSRLDSDNMPSWYNNRPAATAYKWFGYVSLIRGAASPRPSLVQTRFTEKPMHYGQICNGGLGCTTSSGDRTMADYFAVAFDRAGAMRIVYNDTTSQHHGAHLFEARQIAGPGGFGSSVSTPAPGNPMPDPTGDARSPHYAPTGAGPNLPQLDFTGLRLSQPNRSTLRVEMALSSLASLAPPPGKTNALWLTRFQALSIGDGGEEAYRIFYVGAESAGGARPPTFFAGSGASAQGAVPGNGCTTNTPENCKVVQYPKENTATGAIVGNRIVIDVAIQGGFGPNRPILGGKLFSVTALSAGRNADVDLFADVDATRAFDYLLGGGGGTPPPGGDCDVEGGGHGEGKGGDDAALALNVPVSLLGKVAYTDSGQADFRSTRVTKESCDDRREHATVEGEGIDRGQRVSFLLNVSRAGAFTIALSNGYTHSGTLSTGSFRIGP